MMGGKWRGGAGRMRRIARSLRNRQALQLPRNAGRHAEGGSAARRERARLALSFTPNARATCNPHTPDQCRSRGWNGMEWLITSASSRAAPLDSTRRDATRRDARGTSGNRTAKRSANNSRRNTLELVRCAQNANSERERRKKERRGAAN